MHTVAEIAHVITLNPFMPSGLFYHNSLDRSISYIRDVWLVFTAIVFCRNFLTHVKSIDPDQTPRSTASDLGLHCLPMSLLYTDISSILMLKFEQVV